MLSALSAAYGQVFTPESPHPEHSASLHSLRRPTNARFRHAKPNARTDTVRNWDLGIMADRSQLASVYSNMDERHPLATLWRPSVGFPRDPGFSHTLRCRGRQHVRHGRGLSVLPGAGQGGTISSMILLFSVLQAVVAMALGAPLWRLTSRRQSLPCPVWPRCLASCDVLF